MKDYKYLFNEKYPKATLTVLIVLVIIFLAFAMHGDAQALNNGWIH